MVKPEMVRDSYERFGKDLKRSASRKDSAFGRILMSMGKEGVHEVMMEYPGADPRNTSQLTNLLAAFAKELGQHSEGAPTYNADTCLEFHQLLIAVLSGYRRALAAFRDAWPGADKGDDECTDLKKEMGLDIKSTADKSEILLQRADALWRFTHVLWRVVYSRSLRHHLSILDAGARLSLPCNKAGRIDDIDDDVDAELRRLHRDSQSLLLKFLRWMRLHATPFVSLHTISTFSAREVDGIDVSFLVLRSPRASSAPMEPWEATVSKLGKQPSTSGIAQSSVDAQVINAQAVIEFLKLRRKDGNLDKNQLNIFKALSSPDLGFPGNVHCEAMLASIMRYIGQELEMDPTKAPSDLRSIIEVLWLI